MTTVCVAAAGILIYNHKFAKHDVDEAVVNDIDDSGEFENPVADESPRGSQQLALNKTDVMKYKNPAADESQESHSPSPSFCFCNTWHCVVGWPHRFASIQRHAVVLELLRLREVLQQ